MKLTNSKYSSVIQKNLAMIDGKLNSGEVLYKSVV